MLGRLNAQIAELTELLAMERASNRDLQDNVSLLESNLKDAQAARDNLQGLIAGQSGAADAADTKMQALATQLSDEKRASQRALAQVELLNQQIAALRRQIAALEDALNASESRDKESSAKIADLGRRLNVALAQRVQELARYRSDFFGRLREILSQRSDIRVVGDRFVFQSEVLFDS
ncbi:MAG: motB 3, partial [Proteobacteria bacterium]|nr:motB 3 [Pseudomonadota bacterium]